MAVLVTGATGFVGSWLVRALVKNGESVHVLHRPGSSLEEFADLDIRTKLGDITDPESLATAFQDVDTVFHLAGVVGYTRSMRSLMDKVNIQGTANVVAAAAKRKIRVIYMSSVVAVGASFDGRPLNEESPYNVGHLNLGYFETKRAAEVIVREACKKGAIEGVILNPSTIYGPGDAKKGSRQTQIKVAQGRLPFYTGGGVSVVSVHDVIQALLTARDVGRNGERYILSGENITIYDLFCRIAALAGVRPPSVRLPDFVVHALGKMGDGLEKFGRKGPISSENAWTSVLFHWFEHDKAKAELGFRPRPAQEALGESVEWMKQHGYLNR